MRALLRFALVACLVACRPSAPARSSRLEPQAAQAFAQGAHGAVSSAEPRASEVGRAVLARGGNAVDAAIAVAFALAVTHPSAANLGGGGFMLVRTPEGESVAIDYRETAPLAAGPDMFLDARGEATEDSLKGPRAAGIPGVVAGLALAHEKYGSLSWAELVEPAISLAREGHALDPSHAAELATALRDVRSFAQEVTPGSALHSALAETLRTFGKAGGAPYAPGDVWVQPALAQTLAQIAQDPTSFYSGPLAARMADAMKVMGGLWTVEDLAAYRALEREPIRFEYREHTILTMPPPSAGGVTLREILAAAELLKLHELAWDSAERVHLYVEILRRAYADRNELLGDPAFVDNPVLALSDPAYIARRFGSIDRVHATPSASIQSGLPVAEPMHTTHFSVVDARGMAVANTFTLNTDFGALVQIPGTGITLNNEMDDFAVKPGTPNTFGLVQGKRNAIAPGKRMLSSMTPTLVLRGHTLRAVLGSPGGPTITTTVAQILMQLVDHGRSLRDAVEAPRIHHQWLPDQVLVEPDLDPALADALRERGHQLLVEPDIGHANCIEIERETRTLNAVADVKRGGGGVAVY